MWETEPRADLEEASFRKSGAIQGNSHRLWSSDVAAMAPALTEAAGQAQKLKLKLPFEPPSTIPSSRLIAPTRTYRRNNNNNNSRKDESADTLEKLLLACPVADIEFDSDDKGRDGDVSSKTEKKTMAATAEESRIAGSPPSPSCTQCKPTVNGGPVINDGQRTEPIEDRAIDSTTMWTTNSRWPKLKSTGDEHAASSRSLAEKTMIRERFQEKLERRVRRLVRRMCRLRVTQASQHVSRQLLEFVCHQKRIPVGGPVQTKHPLLDALLTEGTSRSSSSTTAAKNDYDVGSIFRRLESGHNENRVGRVGGSSSSAAATTTAVLADKLDVNMCNHMEWTSGSLLTDIGYLDRELDSDATASSSGGESYDELEEDYDDRKTRSTPVHKRAFWKWAVDRAAVVSRWTWLQAHVSDLEYRIRQTSEIHRQIRRMKDSATSASNVAARDKGSSQVNGFVSKNGSDIARDSSGGCCRTRSSSRPVVKRLLVRTTAAATSSGRQPLSNRRASRPNTVRCSCIRTPSSPSFSSSATSSLLAHSCVLCGARGSSVVPTIDTSVSRNERVALLDPSFHSVLSFPRDTSLAIHFEALLKNSEHSKLYSKKKGVNGAKKKARAMQINDHTRKKCRKLKKNATVTLTARLRKISKGRSVSSRKPSSTSDGHRRLRKRPKRSSTSRRRNASDTSGCSSQNVSPVPSPELGDNSSSQASGNSAWGLVMSESRRGFASGGVSVSVLEMLRRKRGESEYDIDNIVIPYSMAASTRVERLQYKEILTPKWRAVPECDPAVALGADDEGDVEMAVAGEQQQQQENGVSDLSNQKEDVSESAVVHRHDVCEVSEKKRFLGFMKNTKPGSPVGVGGVLVTATAAATAARRTRSMRSDSRADSSGANTPDPMSPQPSIAADIDATLLLPPPATPFNNNNNSIISAANSNNPNDAIEDIVALPPKQPSLLQERRRTTSLSKRDRMLDDVRVSTPTTTTATTEVAPSEPYVPVAPWEPRTFPLHDTIYDEMVQEGSKHTYSNHHFTRLTTASSAALSNCGIPESEWNGSGGAPTTTTAPPPPSQRLNHCDQMDCSESANSIVTEQHDLAVK